jgi:hypothetical protein
MGVEWLTVDVRVWTKGKQVPDAAFLSQLIAVPGAEPVETHKSEKEGKSARVTLVAVKVSDFEQEHEPSEAFAKAVRTQLLRAATWLTGQSAGAFACLRDAGFNADVFIESWIDQDQFELELPAEFVVACGRLGLAMKVLTND